MCWVEDVSGQRVCCAQHFGAASNPGADRSTDDGLERGQRQSERAAGKVPQDLGSLLSPATLAGNLSF
jgi:hypothetical protein